MFPGEDQHKFHYSMTWSNTIHPVGDKVVYSVNPLVVRYRIDVAVSPSRGFDGFVLIVCRLDLQFGCYRCERHLLESFGG